MNADDFKQSVMSQIEEVKLYRAQGMHDIVEELLLTLYHQIKESELSMVEKDGLLSLMESEVGPLEQYSALQSKKRSFRDGGVVPSTHASGDLKGDGGLPGGAGTDGDHLALLGDPEAQFDYAKSLIEIHHWDDAITTLKTIAATGYKYEECYELCGECAQQAGIFQEALHYYEIVYSIPGLDDQFKKKILDKITRCQQKKFRETTILPRVGRDKSPLGETAGALSLADQVELYSKYVGQRVASWVNEKGQSFSGASARYRLKDLLHVGNTWAVFDAFCEYDGVNYAALALTLRWRECAKRSFFEWVYTSKMMECEYLSIPHDLALSQDEMFFVIRPYYEMSLMEYMIKRTTSFSLDEALVIAYQILESLGYLHLHLGRDKQKRKIYHLDLRPSRIFLSPPFKVRVAYGGLWSVFRSCCPNVAKPRNLPLAFLPYRAPEQFRSYLWSDKRPLVCTDVYLFGVIFYELLTGVNPFLGESMEEVEILHCDQKPIPPQVVRPEIPDEINELVMQCLEVYPTKRWRSTTQLRSRWVDPLGYGS